MLLTCCVGILDGDNVEGAAVVAKVGVAVGFTVGCVVGTSVVGLVVVGLIVRCLVGVHDGFEGLQGQINVE